MVQRRRASAVVLSNLAALAALATPRKQTKSGDGDQTDRSWLRHGDQRKASPIWIGVGDIAELADQILDPFDFRVTQTRGLGVVVQKQLQVIEIDRRMAVEIALIPESGLAEVVEENLQVVEIHDAAQVGVAGQIRFYDDLAREQIGIVQSTITSVGIGDQHPVGGGITADDLAAST